MEPQGARLSWTSHRWKPRSSLCAARIRPALYSGGMTMTDTPFILRSDKGGVTTLTLNRPETRNALSLGMLLALSAELGRTAADPSVRVVVLAGAGPAFCAGHDLKEIRAENFGSA